MIRNTILILLGVLAFDTIGFGEDDLSQQAYNILESRCYRCHGGSAKQAGIDVLSRDSLLQERGDIKDKFAFVVPGNVDQSQLLSSISGGADSYMPKEGSPEAKSMTDEEKKLLHEWVEAGAEFPVIKNRPFISETQILQAMRDYLLSAKADDRYNIRFFTLTHLHNNPTVSELDLSLYRAALAKAINSLTYHRDIIHPAAVQGTSETVYAINLRMLGWDRNNLWGEILGHYPYALKYDFIRDEEQKQVWKDVSQFSGTDVPYLRADWFVVTATQPPLYHQLLDIPHHLEDLEHRLQLNVIENFLRGEVQRSGFTKSGVSKQNRLIERHTSAVTPYFWISYDFLPKKPGGDLARFPLGPKFDGHPYAGQAFDHDGGEIIWSLPNGMQAYMLIKANGERIDQGPIEVVFDRSAVLGTPAIINGISCMYCHRDGMITDFRDEMRFAETLGGNAREHVLEIFPPHEEMQELTRQDQKRFVEALKRVMSPYLKPHLRADDDSDKKDSDKKILNFPEPIGKVASMYYRDLTPQDLASELGFEDVGDLQARIESNRQLLRYGLGTMIQNPPGTLKREKWETQDGTSLMQDVASQLQLGMPFVPATPRGE